MKRQTLKILFIIGRWPSVSHTAILNQIVELNIAGLDAKYFLSFDTSEITSKNLPADIYKYELDRNVIYIPQPNFSLYKNKFLNKIYIFFSALPYLIKTFLYSPRILYKSLFDKKYGEYKKSFKIIFAIQNLLGRKLNFDIIHCQYAPWGNWGAIFKDLRLINGELVTSFRGYGINDLPKSKPQNFYEFLIKSCQKFTSNTEYTKQNAIKLGFPSDKIKIIHTALNPNKYKFRIRTYKAGYTFNILTAAALKEVKGLEYSILAMKKLKELKPELKFIYQIAGKGELYTKLLKLIKDNDLEKEVKLLGFVLHKDLKILYDKAHLFILPSVTTKNENREGQGLVLQEAQACGIPVIGSNSGGIPEGFVNEKSGFLVEEKKTDQIVEKILEFIQNSEKIPNFGKYGRIFIEKNFNIKIETQKLVSLYKS